MTALGAGTRPSALAPPGSLARDSSTLCPRFSIRILAIPGSVPSGHRGDLGQVAEDLVRPPPSSLPESGSLARAGEGIPTGPAPIAPILRPGRSSTRSDVIVGPASGHRDGVRSNQGQGSWSTRAVRNPCPAPACGESGGHEGTFARLPGPAQGDGVPGQGLTPAAAAAAPR